MWRWSIRAYVSFLFFVILQFICGVLLIRIDHALVRFGFQGLNRFVHGHLLITEFLLGLASGQIYLGSNITGRGWFRSKSGLTYEGFKLEALKPWSWLILSPVLLAGVVFWFAIRKEAGVVAEISWRSFYQGFLAPKCLNVKMLGIGSDFQCGIHLMFLGTWVAAVGYSFAPACRRRAMILCRFLRPQIRESGSEKAEK